MAETPTIGIIASAGGSVIFELLPLLQARGINLVVATDRPCGIEKKCADHGIAHARFDYSDKDHFSQAAHDYFQQHGVQLVLLYYTRFVGAALYEALPTYNIHPSRLPDFAGLNPLERQLAANVALLGATLHQVDATCDGGPIIATLESSYTREQAARISFLQKIYLTLVAIDHCLLKTTASPMLSDASQRFLRDLEQRYQLQVMA